MSLTQHAVPCDKFQLNENDAPNYLSFPCCNCQFRDHHPQSEPCLVCGHNANYQKFPEKPHNIVMGAMSFDEMAHLIVDLAAELKIEIPARAAGVELFGIRMRGMTTLNGYKAKVVDALQQAQLELMRC